MRVPSRLASTPALLALILALVGFGVLAGCERADEPGPERPLEASPVAVDPMQAGARRRAAGDAARRSSVAAAASSCGDHPGSARRVKCPCA